MVSTLGTYSFLDKLVHRLAFSTPMLQLVAADIERVFFREAPATESGYGPIFVTSLPRAGTTLLLTLLHSAPGIATHLYRDMPFVGAPLLWELLSGPFRKKAVLKERAHGDGMLIGYDSPEAFEEILWRSLWPRKYRKNKIDLWTSDDVDAEATRYLREHFAKIVLLRCGGQGEIGRYASKNNANLARLELIRQSFPDAKLLVPIRRPLDHAASLYRQHCNFLAIHRQNAFAMRYMEDVGHYEFGLLHRPIAFPGVEFLTRDSDPETLDYWLAYWIAAFEYVLTQRGVISIVPYEELCRSTKSVTEKLLAHLGLQSGGALEGIMESVHPPTPYLHEGGKVSADLLSRAEDIYSTLAAVSIVV